MQHCIILNHAIWEILAKSGPAMDAPPRFSLLGLLNKACMQGIHAIIQLKIFIHFTTQQNCLGRSLTLFHDHATSSK